MSILSSRILERASLANFFKLNRKNERMRPREKIMFEAVCFSASLAPKFVEIRSFVWIMQGALHCAYVLPFSRSPLLPLHILSTSWNKIFELSRSIVFNDVIIFTLQADDRLLSVKGFSHGFIISKIKCFSRRNDAQSLHVFQQCGVVQGMRRECDEKLLDDRAI